MSREHHKQMANEELDREISKEELIDFFNNTKDGKIPYRTSQVGKVLIKNFKDVKCLENLAGVMIDCYLKLFPARPFDTESLKYHQYIASLFYFVDRFGPVDRGWHILEGIKKAFKTPKEYHEPIKAVVKAYQDRGINIVEEVVDLFPKHGVSSII